MSAPFKLSQANYYTHPADLAYFNNTQIQQYLKCPAMWKALRDLVFIQKSDIKDSKESIPLVHGNYVDTALLENEFVLRDYYEDNMKILGYRGGPAKNNVTKDLDRAVERVKKDQYFMSKLTGVTQKIYCTKDFYGFPFRCRVDVTNIQELFFTDLKTTRGLHHREYVPSLCCYLSWIDYRNYPMQFALYQRVIEIVTGVQLTGYLNAMEKSGSFLFDVWEMTKDKKFMQDLVTMGVRAMREMTDRKDWKPEDMRHCGSCEYCATVRELDSSTMYEPNPKLLTRYDS